MTHLDFEAQTRLARARVESFDKIEREQLKTILLALESGLLNPETGAHFDALVMLRELVYAERKVPKAQKPN
jgi:hypothetical protein